MADYLFGFDVAADPTVGADQFVLARRSDHAGLPGINLYNPPVPPPDRIEQRKREIRDLVRARMAHVDPRTPEQIEQWERDRARRLYWRRMLVLMVESRVALEVQRPTPFIGTWTS